jgi:hypothetical protein
MIVKGNTKDGEIFKTLTDEEISDLKDFNIEARKEFYNKIKVVTIEERIQRLEEFLGLK